MVHEDTPLLRADTVSVLAFLCFGLSVCFGFWKPSFLASSAKLFKRFVSHFTHSFQISHSKTVFIRRPGDCPLHTFSIEASTIFGALYWSVFCQCPIYGSFISVYQRFKHTRTLQKAIHSLWSLLLANTNGCLRAFSGCGSDLAPITVKQSARS